MLFGSIVTDSALQEQLGYQIPVDKVMWDRQGNPKKLSLSSEKVASDSPARPSSKKSRAHKNIGTSSKAVADPQPTRTVMAFGPPPQFKAQGSSSAFVVGEGSSILKRKSSENVSTSGPPSKKGLVDKVRELLQTIASVHFNSIPTFFGRSGEPEDVRSLGLFGWGSFFGCGSFGQRERREPNASAMGLRILLLREMKRHRPQVNLPSKFQCTEASLTGAILERAPC
jgi:hypothetical protein